MPSLRLTGINGRRAAQKRRSHAAQKRRSYAAQAKGTSWSDGHGGPHCGRRWYGHRSGWQRVAAFVAEGCPSRSRRPPISSNKRLTSSRRWSTRQQPISRPDPYPGAAGSSTTSSPARGGAEGPSGKAQGTWRIEEPRPADRRRVRPAQKAKNPGHVKPLLPAQAGVESSKVTCAV